MKKILALISISIFLIGCTPEETTTIIEEDSPTVTEDNLTTTTDLPTTPSNNDSEVRKDIEEQEQANLAADEQIALDQAALEEISKERPLTVEDCEIVKNPEYKESCLVFASAPSEDE